MCLEDAPRHNGNAVVNTKKMINAFLRRRRRRRHGRKPTTPPLAMSSAFPANEPPSDYRRAPNRFLILRRFLAAKTSPTTSRSQHGTTRFYSETVEVVAVGEGEKLIDLQKLLRGFVCTNGNHGCLATLLPPPSPLCEHIIRASFTNFNHIFGIKVALSERLSTEYYFTLDNFEHLETSTFTEKPNILSRVFHYATAWRQNSPYVEIASIYIYIYICIAMAVAVVATFLKVWSVLSRTLLIILKYIVWSLSKMYFQQLNWF